MNPDQRARGALPALGDPRSHLAAIIHSADDAIVSKDLDGVIRSWNRGAERMFGWTAAEAVGRHITLIIPAERRRLEAERQRLLAEAEALNRAKDHLLATVSHELRTPLDSILGYARLLESGSLDEATRRHAVSVITRSALAQGQLIDDLLDLSRVAVGRMQLTLDRCELPAVIDAALDVVRPAADAKGIALTTAFAPDVGPVLGSPDRLRQVVWNLATNAIKFTPAGGRVDVTLTRSNSHAEIRVADDGVGIDPEALPHIFELFRQEDSSTTRAHGGLGLGLALVKSLVELHGGCVRAESPGKGRGASFTVMLPLVTLRGPRHPTAGDVLTDSRGRP